MQPSGAPTNFLERVMGIEPTQPAWKAGALPLSYTREEPVFRSRLNDYYSAFDLIPPILSRAKPNNTLQNAPGGGGWIRTNVGIANGFTARPL